MLDISEINAIEARRKANLKEIYVRIYEQFERRVRTVVEGGGKQTFLRVPAVVVGYPPFDREKAAMWIARQFQNGGFTVQRVSEIDLYVTWVKKKKKKPTQKKKKPPEANEPVDFPDLMNLKKLASEIRASTAKKKG